MPMPHQVMQRIIKRRIVGLEGPDRIRVLNECLAQFPGYDTGPYGDLRKWWARPTPASRRCSRR